MIHNESKHEMVKIISAIKMLLKKNEMTYQDLANKMNLSLPTINRLLTTGNMPIGRLLQICDILRISFDELASLTKTENKIYHTLTDEQELFLCRNHKYLYYLIQLCKRNMLPNEIEEQYRISKKSTNLYLKKLEELKLIERYENNKIKILMTGSFNWNSESKIGKMYSKKMFDHFVKKVILSNIDNGEEETIKDKVDARILGGVYLSEKNLIEFDDDCQKLIIKYREISNYNLKMLKKDKLKTFSILISKNEYDVWSYFDKIENL